MNSNLKATNVELEEWNEHISESNTNPTEAPPIHSEGLVTQIEESKNCSASQATELVSFIMNGTKLFHDANKEVFALDLVTNEVRNVNGRQFRDFLTAKFYEHTGKSVRDQSLREALTTLSGLGRHSGECRTIYRRVAKLEDSYYLDLCQPGNSRTIKLSPGSWEIINQPPVLFIRSDTMQELPEPLRGGSIDALWSLCNIPKEQQLLIVTWIVDVLRPDTPFPILELVGEQGSAKSTSQKVLRRLIDPNSCDLRAAPKTPDDLYVSASVNHIMSYENISHLSSPMQDAICVIATGGGYAKRKLYNDAEECILHAKNPVILNGIAPSITAQDLVDRAITIELPTIEDRKVITEIWGWFEGYHAIILGAILDIACKALSLLPRIELPPGERPRLIEFTLLGMAIAKSMGISESEFLQKFNESRQESIARTIDASPVAAAFIEWFDDSGRLTQILSAKCLLEEVSKKKPGSTDAWPRSPKGFADALRRVVPAFRQLGIVCECLGKRGSNVKWKVSCKEKL